MTGIAGAERRELLRMRFGGAFAFTAPGNRADPAEPGPEGRKRTLTLLGLTLSVGIHSHAGGIASRNAATGMSFRQARRTAAPRRWN
jgi:hypothetical protein